MPHRTLTDFLEALGQAGELVRVERAVAPRLEAARFAAENEESRGKALLFGAVAGHDIPLAANLLGTEARICRALGVGCLEDVTRRVALLAAAEEPEGWFERLKLAPHESLLRKVAPRSVKSGVCQQVIRLGSDVNLAALPVVQSLPTEAGPFITAGLLFTADPEVGRVVGRYPLQVLDAQRLALCVAPHEEPARLLGLPERRDEPLPVAIVLGGDPVCLLAASAPVLPGWDACALAGYLREKPLELVRCRSNDLEVPADAELVIEGHIDRREACVEAGPYATPLGTCAPPRPAPVVHVTAITHRANPVFPALLGGPPPNEACTIARSMWQVLLPLVRLAIPELVDCSLPDFGGVRHWAIVSIRKTYPGQARKVASAVWGYTPLMFAKLLVIVDDDVNVRDEAQVLAALAAQLDPAHDVFQHTGPTDPQDPAAQGPRSQRLGMDATRGE